ncbi:Ornithine carbamoyltransferase, mitochondrial [Hondaea fermentalgiana]|uniref:ornithine carbamoyltransferase n=1 Tax=Hondaea fermentalgiana TaxID=2315210 RepID=A0A2R5GS41_9STRA|nr:Ornithine carbamoyltransferase, mitochondrial [Hondaea fermentalgiana]|eukprot:GBG33119.1 Ornithine carbamoyltransferase, mitochondrial [Hondaea fermentalgiana]
MMMQGIQALAKATRPAQAAATKTTTTRLAWRAFSTSGPAEYTQEHRKTLEGVKGRHLMRIDDYCKEELEAILAFSRHLKDLVKAEKVPQALHGKSVACIFQKRSTRTRVSTETGMNLLGGSPLFLSSQDVQLGVNETIKDSALVLSRFNSLILARVFGHDTVHELAEHATVPVINALSDMHHPLQTLADFMTIQERFGPENVKGKTLAWVGDGNNVLHDLMLAAPPMGVNLRICTPEGYRPDAGIMKDTEALAQKFGTDIWVGADPIEGVAGCNIVVTDTWVSMGQEEEAAKRIKAFEGYEVNSELMSKGGAADDWIFMHCLPRHPEEVSDEVFYSDRSVVFDEAEARMYTVMAVMATQLGVTL